ncbi:MAG: hypothetical protein ACLGH3_07550 [Actinomycetota bacterium]
MRNFRRVTVGTVSVVGLTLTMLSSPVVSTPLGVQVPVEPTAIVIDAIRDALGQSRWLGIDGHVHSDHSHDAGFFHQQEKTPESHDTFVRDQIDEAERVGEDLVTLTDHRTYDQAYDPEYRSSQATLLDGEEWGGYPHATAWGIVETLVQGPDLGDCGVTLAAREVRAQDGIFGIAHPEDGQRPCVSEETIKDIPIDHLEAFRWPHTNFWASNIAADNRVVPVTGSDNHFRQLHGTEAGVGGNSTLILAEDATQAAIVEAVRAGRVASVTRMLGPTLSTLLDADGDGEFETLTGGWSEPTGPTVRVAFEARNAQGLRLQVLDDQAMVAEELVTLPVQTFVFDLPSDRPFWRGQLDASPTDRITGGVLHDYLSYIDSLRLISSPVYLSPESLRDPGSTPLITDAAYAGFPDTAISGTDTLLVTQERAAGTYRIVLRNITTGTEQVLSSDDQDAREPAIAARGSKVVVAYTDRSPTARAGRIWLRISDDGGATFPDAEGLLINKRLGAMPDVAISEDGDIHVVWSSMEDGFKIRHKIAGSDDSTLLSSAVSRLLGRASYSPYQEIRHVPAAIDPTIAIEGDDVVVAWSDNREDVTPLRNGTPDDWGIYVASSSDSGGTWSQDARISPRHDKRGPDPDDPERMEGNPAKHPTLAYLDGRFVAAWSDANGSGSRIRSLRSTDGGATWSGLLEIPTPSNEMAYRPALGQIAGMTVVAWQQSDGKRWLLHAADVDSAEIGAAFSLGPFAGFPSLAGDTIFYTASGADRYGIATTQF